MQDPAKPEPTVEQALASTLEYLRAKYDDTLTPEQRAEAAKQYDAHKALVTSFTGDRDLFDVGRRSIAAIEFAENRLKRARILKARPQDGEKLIEQQFPRLAQHNEAWRAFEASGAGDALRGTTPDRPVVPIPPRPDGETLREAFLAGDPVALAWSDIPNLVSDDGRVTGGVKRESFLRDMGDLVGLADPAIEIDDELADRPSSWFDVEKMTARYNTAQILHAPLQTRDDGTRFVTVKALDGTERTIDIPDLGTLRDMTVTSADGQVHKVRVDDEMIRDITQSREGGFFAGTIGNFLAKNFVEEDVTFYGKMHRPRITGNDLVDGELMRNPVWQRAVMDAPRAKGTAMWWWDAGRQLYSSIEFAGLMLATEGVGGVVAKTAGTALKGTAAYRSIAPYTSLAGAAAKSMTKGFLGGSRAPRSAVRVPGFYYDARQIAEEVWYNAAAGMVNGEWEPGDWVQQGVAEGVGEWALGGAARAMRHGTSKLLKAGWMQDTRFGQWTNKFDADTEAAFEGVRKRVLERVDRAKQSVVADAFKKGLLDEQRLPVAGELIGAAFDTVVVGTGFGAYIQAHRNAAEEGRSDIGVSDFIDALGDPGTWSNTVGMMLGHGMSVGGSAVWNRNSPDAVPLVPGLFGIELGPKQKKALNDFAAYQAWVAHDILTDPEVAGLTLAGIDVARDSDLDVALKIQEGLKQRRPEDAVPDPISGSPLGALVQAQRGDPHELEKTLRFEETRGLERMYTTLSNARPGEYPADWNADIRDLKDVLIDHMERNEAGEAHGQALTGIPAGYRENVALQQYREGKRKEAEERRARKIIRRQIVRTLGQVAKVKKGEAEFDESVALVESRWEDEQAILRRLDEREVERKRLLDSRASCRELRVSEILDRARKQKNAEAKKALEALAKEQKRLNKAQEINDRNAAKRGRAADGRSRAQAKKRAAAYGETGQLPLPTAEQAQADARAIAKNLETTVEHAHLQGDPAAIVDAATEGLDPGDLAGLAGVAQDARARKAEKKARTPRGRRLREGEQSVAFPQPELGELARLIDKDMVGHVNTGAEVFHPAEAGKHLDAMRNAANAGAESALWAAFGATDEVRATGRARQQSIAMGMLLASTMNPRVDGLIIALTQLPAADVAALRKQLEQRYAGQDEAIADALANWQVKLGKAVLAPAQLRAKETQRLLRLIALGATVKTGQGMAGILAGGKRRDIPDDVRGTVVKSLVERVGGMPLISRGTDITQAALALAAAQHQQLGDAIAALPRTGLRTEGLWLVLKKKVAYQHTGKRTADDTIEGTNLTVREVTDGLIAELSKGAVGREAIARESVDATSEAAAGGGEGELHGSQEYAAEEDRRKPTYTDLELAQRVIEIQASAAALSRAVSVRGLANEAGKAIVNPKAPPHEVRRIENEVYRGLLDGDAATVELLLRNEWSEQDIIAAAVMAKELRAEAQDLMRYFVALRGMPKSKLTGDAAQRELEHLFRALELKAKGKEEGLYPIIVDGEARAMLDAGGWLNPDGTVRRDAAGELLDLARETIFDGLEAAERAAADGIGGIMGIVEAREGLTLNASVEPFYAGISKDRLFGLLHLFADWSTGFYDRRLDKPFRHKYETISIPGLTGGKVQISASAWVDRLGKQKKLGAFHNTVTKFFLRAWVKSVSGKVRGVQSTGVRARNYEFWRADTDGRAKMHRFLSIVEAAMQRIVDLGLTTEERLLLSRLLAAGAKRDIRSREAWVAVFGAPYERLYPVFLELNDIFTKAGEELVQQGVLDPKRRDALLDAYLPRHYVKMVYGAMGKPLLSRNLERTLDASQVGGFEHVRERAADSEHVRRMYDIAYVLPKWASQVSQVMRVNATLNRMLELNVHVSRYEYLNMPDSERWQYVRLAVPGRIADDPGPSPALTPEEHEALSPIQPVLNDEGAAIQRINAELAKLRALELKERKEATLEQIIVHEYVKKVRAFHDGPKAPKLTERMAKQLDTLERCYVPINVAVEVGILIDQTDLGPSVNDSASFKFASNVSLAWRRMRTVYNPGHWFMQVASNWLTNAATGKVPLHDILNPRGSYWRSAKTLGRWQEMIAKGEDPAMSSDEEVRHAHRFMLRGGVNTFAAQFNDPVNGNDIAAGFIGRIQRQWIQSGQTMGDTLTTTLMEQAAGSGRALADARTWVDAMANGTSPESRAEALRALHGMYGFLDLVPKYAAQIEGEKMGWDEEAAYHWGTEGTGDFADVNPRIRQLTTNFSLSHGPLYGRARVGLGLGERVGTARPGASAAESAWRWTESIRHSGLAGPFWMYRFAMNPTLGRAMVNMPMKAAVTAALFTFGIRVLSAVMADDEDDQKLLIASHAGRDSFLHANFDEATFDAYARNYGRAPAWGMGVWTVAVNDWVHFTKAYLRNFIRDDPEAAMLFRARGPTIGGQESVLDFESYFPGLSTGMWLADKLQGIDDPKPFAQPEGMGVAHLPAAMASVAIAVAEGLFGVEGKSKERVRYEHLAELAAEWSTPMAGLPWIFSREGQRIIGAVAWNGRSVGEMVDRLPQIRPQQNPLVELGLIAADTVLPMRKLSSRSAIPSEGGMIDTFEDLLGTRLRTRDMPRGDTEEREAARRAALSKEAVLRSLGWAYRQARENGAPLAMWNGEALDLERDLVITDRDARQVYDVNDKPQTQLGKFIRNAARTDDERQLLTADVVAHLIRHRDDIVAFAEDPRGLANRVGLPPVLYERMLAGVWDKETNAPELLKLIHQELTDKGARKQSGGQYDDVIARLWHQADMPRLTKGYRSGANLDRVLAVERALGALRAAHPDTDFSKPVEASELRGMMKATAVDMLPSLVNRRPDYTFFKD